MEGAGQGQAGPGGLRPGVGPLSQLPARTRAAQEGAEKALVLHREHPAHVKSCPYGVGTDLQEVGKTPPPAVPEPDGGLEAQPPARVDDGERQAEPAAAVELQDGAEEGLREVARPGDNASSSTGTLYMAAPSLVTARPGGGPHRT